MSLDKEERIAILRAAASLASGAMSTDKPAGEQTRKEHLQAVLNDAIKSVQEAYHFLRSC